MADIRRHKGQPEGPLDASADLLRAITERDEARRKRVFDRLYFEMNAARCDLDGREPLELPEELEDTPDDVLHTLKVTIPAYRVRGGWKYGEGKEFLDHWQDELLEKLAELTRGDEQ